MTMMASNTTVLRWLQSWAIACQGMYEWENAYHIIRKYKMYYCFELDWLSSTGFGLIWVEVLFATTLVNNFAKERRNSCGNQTPTIDGRRYPWMATYRQSKKRNKTNERTRTQVTTNRLATHQDKHDIFYKTENKENNVGYIAQTTQLFSLVTWQNLLLVI